MPGALVILGLLIVVAIAAWIAAWCQTRDPSRNDPREEFRQLQRHAAWLEQRLDLARRERWNSDMIADLSRQLGDACQQLSQARGGVIASKLARTR